MSQAKTVQCHKRSEWSLGELILLEVGFLIAYVKALYLHCLTNSTVPCSKRLCGVWLMAMTVARVGYLRWYCFRRGVGLWLALLMCAAFEVGLLSQSVMVVGFDDGYGCCWLVRCKWLMRWIWWWGCSWNDAVGDGVAMGVWWKPGWAFFWNCCDTCLSLGMWCSSLFLSL